MEKLGVITEASDIELTYIKPLIISMLEQKCDVDMWEKLRSHHRIHSTGSLYYHGYSPVPFV